MQIKVVIIIIIIFFFLACFLFIFIISILWLTYSQYTVPSFIYLHQNCTLNNIKNKQNHME